MMEMKSNEATLVSRETAATMIGCAQSTLDSLIQEGRLAPTPVTIEMFSTDALMPVILSNLRRDKRPD